MKTKIRKQTTRTPQESSNEGISYLAGILLVGSLVLGKCSLLKAAGEYVKDSEEKATHLYYDFQKNLNAETQEMSRNPAYADKLLFTHNASNSLFGYSPDTTLEANEKTMELMHDACIKAIKKSVKESGFYEEIRISIKDRMLSCMEPGEAERVLSLRKPEKKSLKRGSLDSVIDVTFDTSLNKEGIRLTGKLTLETFGLGSLNLGKAWFGVGVSGSKDYEVKITELQAIFEKLISDEQVYARFGIKQDLESQRTGVNFSLSGGNPESWRWAFSAGYQEGNYEGTSRNRTYVGLDFTKALN